MTLSEFLKFMHSYVGQDWDNQDYFANLLLFIMPEPASDEDIKADERHEYYPYNGSDDEKDMLGRIYNGKPLPKKKARMVKAHFKADSLVEEIGLLSSDSKTKLRAELAGKGITVHPGDEGKICKEIIELLIDAAAIGENEIDVRQIGVALESIAPIYDDSDLKPDFGVRLLAETKQHCPMLGCFKPLYFEEAGRSTFDYRIVQVNPRLPRHVADNLVAMCPTCATRYMAAMTKEKVAELEDIKLNISSIMEALDSMPEERLVAGVKRVVSKIGSIPIERIMDLNYNPTEVIKKMDKTDPGLFFKIQHYVSKYYPIVRDDCKEMEIEGTLNFEKFCSQMKFKYQDLRDRGLDQTQIFDVLTEWIAGETHEEKSSCEVVVSYFVQKCEVFEAQEGADEDAVSE